MSFQIPKIGLGTWKVSPAGAGEAVKAAIVAGFRHIDCAAGYDNEKEIGNVLTGIIGSHVDRKDLFITSKLWNTDHGNVREAFTKTLNDLRLSYLDLYLIHWPMGYDIDEVGMESFGKTPISQVWAEMEKLVDEGLIKQIGLSNFNSSQVEEVFSIARIKPTVLQVECHPYLVQKNLSEFAKAKGMLVEAYAPLGSPDRPGYLKMEDEPVILQDPLVTALAAKYKKSPAQILIRFQVERGHIVLVKSTNPERLKENLGSLGFTLQKGDVGALEALDRGFRYYPMLNEAEHPRFPFNTEF